MEWKQTNKFQWHKWFAWYPIRLGHFMSSERMIWLKTIERKRSLYGWDYKLIEKIL